MNGFDDIRALGAGEILIPDYIAISLRPKESFTAIAKNKQGELKEFSFGAHDIFFVESVSISTTKQVIFKAKCQDKFVLFDESDFDKYLNQSYASLAIEDALKYAKEGSFKASVSKFVSKSVKTKSKKVGIWA